VAYSTSPGIGPIISCCLEKNQERFGKKQVKFGYVVYTEPEVARRLLSSGFVMVGHAKVAVKEMDGQPAVFSN
jgi:hypothetical protein